ncbi:MAG: low molecular weight protein-tyrosine-phosphatase [Bacteroidota bacterium]
MVKVLFVCLGNICRSPMAEAIFKDLLKEKSLENIIEVDSCGTSDYHIGEPPDPRALKTLGEMNIETDHKARQLGVEDFEDFDFVIPMDESNLTNTIQLMSKAKNPKARIKKMRFFDPEHPDADVPDPYFGGQDGFEKVYKMLRRSSEKLLNEILKSNPDLKPV